MPLSLQLFSEDSEGAEWVHCIVCLMWAHTLQRKGRLCVSVALQSNKKLFGAIETTRQSFIACSSYSLLQYYVNLCFSYSSAK
jgi:hypothetical protein